MLFNEQVKALKDQSLTSAGVKKERKKKGFNQLD